MKLRNLAPGGPPARILLASFLVVFSPPAGAVVWDNSNGTGLWSTPANWDTNVEPTSAADVTFPLGLAGAITTTTTEQALSLTFNDAYTLSGGTLALASGNSINVADGVTATINSALTITGGLSKTGDGTLALGASNTNSGGTVISAGKIRVAIAGALGAAGSVTTVNGGTTLEIAAGISLDRPVTLKHGGTLAGLGTATNNGVLTIDAAATTVTLATDVAGDTLVLATAANELTGGSGSTEIGLAGPGSVRLSAASDFDGSWNLPAGRLELGAAGALGDQATSVTLAGGALSARINTATTFTGPAASLVMTADSSLLSDRVSSSVGVTHTFGTLSMGTHVLTVEPGASAASGTAGITLGNVTLGGNPTFAVNDLLLTNGKLTTGSLLGGVARTITKTGAGDLAVTGGASDLPAGSAFSATGGGTIEMLFPSLGASTPVAVTAAQNPFGGATVSVTDGALRLLADGSGTTAVQTYQVSSAITLGGTVTLDPDRRTGSNTNKTFELPGLTLAAGTVMSMSGDNTHGVRLTGPLALLGDATLKGIDVSGKDGLLTLDGGISGAAGDGLTIGGGTSALNLTVNATGTYGGGTTMDGGNVTLNAANALGTGATILNGGSLTVNTDGALAGTVTLNGGTLRVNDPNALSANPVSLSGGTLDFRNNDAAGIVTGGLTVSGTSVMSLGNNGSGSSKVFDFPLLNVSGVTVLTITPSNSYVPNIASIVLAGDLTLNQTGTTRIQSISEDASARSFIKTGTGTVEMEAAGTYSGGTEVLAGVLLVEHENALGSGALTLGDTSGSATATARFIAGLTIPNDIVARSGGSGLITLDASAGDVIWEGNVELQRTLTLDNGGSADAAALNGQITGAGDLSKVSAGEVVLGDATNSFGSGTAGSVTVSDGFLTVSTDGALGNVSNGVTLAGTDGALKINGTFASSRVLTFSGTASGVAVTAGNEFTVNTAFAGTGAFIKSDAGTLILPAGLDNSARGTSTSGITGGILRVQGVNGLSNAGPLTLNGSSGTVQFLADADTNFGHPVTADGTGTIHVGRAAGGSGTNGRHTLGNLAMASGNLTITGADGYGLTVGAAAVTSSNTITNNAPGTLILASLTGTPGSSNLTMTMGGSGDIHLTGALAEGAGAGNYGLTKTGAGTLRFGSSVAEFARATSVQDGTLDLNGLSYPVTDLTLGGATSALGAQVVTGVAGSLELADALTFSSLGSPAGASITGSLVLTAVDHTFAINDSSSAAVDLTIDGVISGSAGTSISKTGNGTLRFSGAGNTQPGLVSISAGLLELAKSAGDAIGAGGLSITGGTVRSLASHQINDAAAVSLSSANDAILDLNNFTETTGPLSLTQTDASDYTAVKTGATGTLVLAGNLSFNNNSDSSASDARNILITGTGTDGTATTDGTLDLGGAVRTIHVATTTVSANEPKANATIETQIINGGIIKTGPRTLFLGHANNTFAGGLEIAGGTVTTAALGSLGSGPISFTHSGTTSAGLNFGSITGTMTGDLTLGGSGSGSTTLTYSAPAPATLILSGNIDLERELTVDVVDGSTNNGDSAVLDVAGLIDDAAGAFGLVKIGNGTLKLAAGNTFSAATTVQSGILAIPADSALGDTTAELTIDGGCLQALASFSLARDVVFGTGGGSVRVDSPSLLEIPGDLTWDSGTSAFFGSGTTVLSGTTTGSGGDLLLGGPTDFADVPFSSLVGLGHVLSLRGTATLPAGNLSITNNAVLELGTGDFTRALGTGPGEVQLPTSAGGGWAAHGSNRAVNLGGAGATVLWGQASPAFLSESTSVGDLILGSATGTHTVDFQNPIELNSAATSVFRDLVVHDGPAALDARISGGISQSSLTASAYVDLDCAGTLEISGPLTGRINLDMQGPGTVILSGTNSRTGDLNVYEGTLVVAGDASWNTPDDIYIEVGAELDVSALSGPIGLALNDYLGVFGTLTGDVATASYFEGLGLVAGDLHALAGAYVYPYFEGQLHVTGDFTLDATALLDLYVEGVTPQADFNQMKIDGAVNLAGDLSIFYFTGIPEGYGDTLVMILNDGSDPINGTFAGLPEGAGIPIGNGLAFQVTYQANGDGGAVANDFGITLVPDTFGSDLALTGDTPVAVDLNAEIVINYTIDSPGPGLITDGVLQIVLPGNATLVSSTPAGTESAGVLSIPLPSLAAPDTTSVELRLTAPPATAAVSVSAYLDSSLESDFANNDFASTTAVMAGGGVVLGSFEVDPVADTVSVGIDTIAGIRYVLESSLDLEDWTIEQSILGDGNPFEAVFAIDQTREFFRFSIVP